MKFIPLCTAVFLMLLSTTVMADVQTIREAVGNGPQSSAQSGIQATVDTFRSDLGNPNNGNAVGSQGSGRRQITWDGSDSASAPSLMPGNFFNAAAPRGVLITGGDARTTFQISADGAGNNATNTVEEFGNINATYPTAFSAFSTPRVFAALNSTVLTIDFVIPGSLDPATVTGFGAVFSDVDTAGSTKIEYFDVNGQLLLERPILSITGNESLSFLGVTFTSPELAQVRITVGEGTLGSNDVTQTGGNPDIVVLDDFIYGEPQLVAPIAPMISSPADDAQLTTSLPTVSGVAEIGSVIELLDGATSIGMATTGSDRTWSLTPNTPLSDGQHTLTATATNSAGTSDASEAITVSITTASDAAPAVPSIHSPENGTTVSTPLPLFSGSGDSSSTITIFDNGSSLGTTVVGTNGQWSFSAGNLLSEGTHTFTASASNETGSSTTSSAVSVTINAIPDESPTAPGITITKRQVQIEMPAITGVSAYRVRVSCRGKGKRRVRKNFIFTNSNPTFKKPRGKRCTYKYAILGNGEQSPFSATSK